MTLQTDPIHGRIHPIFGFFMGGSDLNDDYDTKKSLYKLTTQLCNPEQSISPEITLMDARSDTPK